MDDGNEEEPPLTGGVSQDEMSAKSEAEPEAPPDETASSSSAKRGNAFHVDSSCIASIPVQDQAEELKLLGLNVYNQTEFEEGVLKQVDDAFKQEEMFIKQQIMQRDLQSVLEEIRITRQRIRHLDNALKMAPTPSNFTKDVRRKVESLKREKDNKERQLKKLLARQRSLSSFCDETNENDTQDMGESIAEDESEGFELAQMFKPAETKQEQMIRTGQMTPFGTIINKAEKKKAPAIVQSTGMTDFEKYLLDQSELNKMKKSTKRKKNDGPIKTENAKKVKNDAIREAEDTAGPSKWKTVRPLSPPKKIKHRKKPQLGTITEGSAEAKKLSQKHFWKNEEQVIDLDELEKRADSDYVPSSDDEHVDEHCKKKQRRKSSQSLSDGEQQKVKSPRNKKLIDDGNQTDYLDRIRKWHKERLIKKHQKITDEDGDDEEAVESDNEYEDLDGGYKIPLKIWNKLYKYQQTCVQWLWELHCQRCGGIIGDEMGLGKTIQVIAFFAGLWNSKMLTRGDIFQGLGPVLIVTPTTIMHQWVKEFHVWWPPIRVAVLHDSGSYTGTKESLVRHINNNCGVLVTSYSGLTIYQDELLRYDWHYVILDEGHKIRNPDAQATLVCKQFRTPHRLILSGSPLQNNLKELWSLFDFIFPGKLGTLPIFMQQFSVPITLGGYANASDFQVQTAFKCATILRDTISPYLLRRMKADVKMNLNLPRKNEQVLFCRLTDEQKQCYKEYLESDQLKSIIDGRLKVFVGLIHLRKICNHPDLYSGGPKHFGNVDETTLDEDQRFGFWKRSGKMIVIEAILKLWHQQKHRVLFFTQSRQMIHILEYFIKTRDYTYMKMDGTTSISSRQPLINQFNTDPSIFIFLLTTRVGGLGVNLTGADRVIIYDPDWNPSTDLQARERAWRIGQRKDVTIYRLLTSGTIEEKIYHRQIFKQFLTNRVLKDPRQRRFFKNNDLYELFTLKEQGSQGPESLAIFAGTGSEIKADSLKKKHNKSPCKKEKIKINHFASNVSKEKLSNFDSVMNSTSNAKGMGQEMNIDSCLEPTNKVDDVNVSKDGRAIKNEEDNPTAVTNCDKSSYVSSEDSSNSVSAAKLAKMKELAKQLSQQITKKYQNNKNCTVENENLSSIPSVSSQEAEIAQKNNLHDSRRKKAKKKKQLNAVFEGHKISNLVGQGIYKNDEIDTNHKQSAKHDDYVLQKLFAKSGVHSALRHDVIMEDADPDYALVEKEAERVAKEAVQKMKMSRRFCYQADSGIPNWTGSQETRPKAASTLRFGQKKNNNVVNTQEKASLLSTSQSNSQNSTSSSDITSSVDNAPKFSGGPSFSSSGIMSSSQLLARIKARNQSSSDSEDEGSNTTSSVPSSCETKYDELLVDLRNFIAFQSSVNGEATTQEILEAFQGSLPAENSPVFKSLLHKICNFQRSPAGRGVWYLKSEFR